VTQGCQKVSNCFPNGTKQAVIKGAAISFIVGTLVTGSLPAGLFVAGISVLATVVHNVAMKALDKYVAKNGVKKWYIEAAVSLMSLMGTRSVVALAVGLPLGSGLAIGGIVTCYHIYQKYHHQEQSKKGSPIFVF